MGPTGKPKLKLSENLDAKVVDDQDGNEKDCDPDTGVNLLSRNPVLDNERSSRQLIGSNNDVSSPISKSWGCGEKLRLLEPVRVAECKTEGRVAEPIRVSSEAGGQRQPRCHFAEGAPEARVRTGFFSNFLVHRATRGKC